MLGCDTLVALDGAIFGKPARRGRRARDAAGAGRAPRTRSSAAWRCWRPATAKAAAARGEERGAIARTAVTFRAIDDALLDWYIATGEWRGRAGGYAIQGAGAALVRAIEGDYENVVGLPVATLLDVCPQLLAVRF